MIARVTCLASAAAEGRLRKGLRNGEVGVRVHVCRCRPCEVEAWHPSKFGTVPAPYAHGQVLELLSEPDEAALAKYATVDAVASIRTGDVAPAAAGVPVGADLPVGSDKGEAGHIEPLTLVAGAAKEEPLTDSDERSICGKNAAPAVGRGGGEGEQIAELADVARLGTPHLASHLAHAIARRAEEVRRPARTSASLSSLSLRPCGSAMCCSR